METVESLTLLDERCTLRVLRVLLINGGRVLTGKLIKEASCGQRAVYNAIECLGKLNLVKEEREAYHNRRWFVLTEKGEVVAEKAKELMDLVSSTVFVKPVLKDFSVRDGDPD